MAWEQIGQYSDNGNTVRVFQPGYADGYKKLESDGLNGSALIGIRPTTRYAKNATDGNRGTYYEKSLKF